MSLHKVRSQHRCALFDLRMRTAQQYADRARHCDSIGDVAGAEYYDARATEIAARARADRQCDAERARA